MSAPGIRLYTLWGKSLPICDIMSEWVNIQAFCCQTCRQKKSDTMSGIVFLRHDWRQKVCMSHSEWVRIFPGECTVNFWLISPSKSCKNFIIPPITSPTSTCDLPSRIQHQRDRHCDELTILQGFNINVTGIAMSWARRDNNSPSCVSD